MSENPSEKKQEISKNIDSNIESICESNEQVKQVTAEVIKSEFSGPIPPPSIIKGYEEILPGSADRIIAMAEKQSLHRQDMERKMIYSESRDSLLGILFAFSLGIGCIIAAIVMVVTVPENSGAIAGSILGVTGIGSIIATFIRGTRSSYSSNKSSEKKPSDKDTPTDKTA